MLRNVFDPRKKWRVVMYVRMSTKYQNPRSPDQQIANIRETMARLGYDWTVVKIYRDDGVSGRYTRKRPQFQQMISDLRSGVVQASFVLVDTFSRLTRAEHSGRLIRRLEQAGVLVLTAQRGFENPNTISGKMTTFVDGLKASEDGNTSASDIVRGKKDAIRQGRWPGGPVPFGYRLRFVVETQRDGVEVGYRVLEIDPDVRWIAEEVFRLADESEFGTPRLATFLNSHPAIPDVYKPFHPSTIGHMLDNTLYYGEYIWGRNCTGIVDDVRQLQALPESEWERNPNFCEPLVAKERWERVQLVRTARKRSTGTAVEPSVPELVGIRAPGVALKYMLTGLVRCASCGRSMTPASSSVYEAKDGSQRRYVAYACPGRAGHLCPNRVRIPEEWLRNVVLKLVSQRLFRRG